MPRPSPPRPAEIQTVPLAALTPSDLAAWAALEHHAIEPNAYLSPAFVRAAARHVTPSSPPLMLLVTVGGVLAGIGPFEAAPASLRVPRKHLRAYRHPYSFLSGLLVHREYATDVAAGIVEWMATSLDAPPAIAFDEVRADGPVAALIRRRALERDLAWWSLDPSRRAVLHRATSADAARGLSKRRRSRVRKAMSDLEAVGEVRAVMRRGADARPDVVERFLELEARGWKGEEGTAMASTPAHATFFREIVQAFAAEDRVVFNELWCGDRVIAGMVHFIAGREAFSFKIGWDPAFREQSPGVLQECLFMERFPDLLPEVDRLDSGAQPGSFIDDLWPDRVALEWGCLVSRALLTCHARAISALQEDRRVVRDRIRAIRGTPRAT